MIKLKSGYRTKYRATNTYRFISQTTQLKKTMADSYKVDMENLKESLRRIENLYYSSNVKLDRIQKKRTSQMIRMKLPKILKSYKRLFVKD